MRWLNVALDRVSLGLVMLAGLLALVSALLGTADALGTQLFESPLPGVFEFISDSMVVIVFGSLVYVQRARSNIKMELLYNQAGPRWRAAMDVTADLTALVFFGLLLGQALPAAISSWIIREASAGLVRFPIYPAKFVIVVGTLLLLVQLLVDLVVDVRRLVGKRAVSRSIPRRLGDETGGI